MGVKTFYVKQPPWAIRYMNASSWAVANAVIVSAYNPSCFTMSFDASDKPNLLPECAKFSTISFNSVDERAY